MRVLILILALLATPALADVTGPARVIDGDTLEIHDKRIRLRPRAASSAAWPVSPGSAARMRPTPWEGSERSFRWGCCGIF